MTEKQTKFKETEIGMIPEDWTVSPIGNVCSVRRGASPRPIHNFISESGMPWVKISDASAQNTRFIEWTGEFIKQEGVKNSVTVHPGDLIVSNSATPGIPRFMKIDACIHDGWLLIENFKESTKEFLYYTFLNERSKLVGIADGTVFRNLKTDIVRDHKIALPEVKEQRAIASILSSLDDKIELNQRMNKTLEEIGQAIFKHWFVDFEFPNEEGKPYKSSGGEMVYNEELGKEIPKGWRVGRLGELVEQIESGSRPKGGASDSGIPSIGAENILGLGLYDYLSTKYVPEDFYEHMKQGKVRDFDVLFYKDGAQLGRTSILGLGFPFKKCCINEHVFIIRVKSPLNQIFLYFWSTLSSTKDDIRNLNTNSAQPGINKEGVKSLRILVPQRETSDEFERRIKPLIVAIFKNCLESQILSQIRDALLPKLMSGKIRVPLEGKE